MCPVHWLAPSLAVTCVPSPLAGTQPCSCLCALASQQLLRLPPVASVIYSRANSPVPHLEDLVSLTLERVLLWLVLPHFLCLPLFISTLALFALNTDWIWEPRVLGSLLGFFLRTVLVLSTLNIILSLNPLRKP